ncbi:sugar O-acyltransferase, sialic acid O-acetyltransferase NeuD family [Flexibacter flexilis DSM 6793]|uniref:Sugar O-acyltransferase, sialic acid O-acetyltransferase NeuD family n=1 Tax=Flexibacter flexilis DSM 6793 TaxID=927664 RepID=A0A1I1FKB1_9BACT|nr:acetyltransferase [Flexibacter flexilis]SFB99731.1 sugar O-acyltransferase, sialic acid O-acetyltransferase NeuD family [Flexibacter flexilis DSM 6793]
MAQKKVAIVGAGDLGQLMAHHLLHDKAASEVIFYDDYATAGQIKGLGLVQGAVSQAVEDYQSGVFDEMFLAIGYKHFAARQAMFEQLCEQIKFGVFVHSSSYVDEPRLLGAGTFILPGCTMDRGASTGQNVFFNVGCRVAHDTHVGKHSFFGPGVTLAGFVRIGQRCFVGVGTVVIDNITFADDIQTGGGAVVTKPLTESGLYVGVPAKKLNK